MSVESVFTGLKVVDLASFIAGPAATTVLSDFGADVIKVEPPGVGDPYRYFYRTPPNPPLAANYTWQLTNRNKRSLVVDLKNPRGTEVLQRLAQWADVFVTNFPPRVKKALKLTYEKVSAFNPRLIYADLTGYGEVGPEADKPDSRACGHRADRSFDRMARAVRSRTAAVWRTRADSRRRGRSWTVRCAISSPPQGPCDCYCFRTQCRLR